MGRLGFVKSEADKCLYVLHKDGQVTLLVLVYVDDAALASQEITQITKFKKAISEYFPIKDLGDLRHILGIQITRDRAAHTITLNQTAISAMF
jgi:hypothetical protein